MTNGRTNAKEIVIVTGSSGLIGGAVINALRHEYQVVGFDLDGEPQPPPEVECICVDLTDDESVNRGLDRVRFAYGVRIASVIHLAAYYDFSGDESPLYEEVTVKGTERLLNGLQDFEVEQFVFTSTMLVHEPTPPGTQITEQSPVAGHWPYPESKIRTEQRMAACRKEIPTVVLRVAGVYTDECDSMPISRQIHRVAENRPTGHVFPGNINHGQAFVHLDDLIDAIRRCIDRRRKLPNDQVVMLIGEEQTESYDRLQRRIAQLVHGDENWETHEVPRSIAETGIWLQDKIPGLDEPFIKPKMIAYADDHYELDISRARELLGWSPSHRLIRTLPDMIQRLNEDPENWCERHGLERSSMPLGV